MESAKPVVEEECEHQWVWIRDWEGDPRVINGVNDLSHWECAKCGAEDYKTPRPLPGRPEPDE